MTVEHTLIVVVEDVAGSMNALARELRRSGHPTRVVSLAGDTRLSFPADIQASIDGGRELLALASSCRRLHLVDCQLETLGPWAEPLLAKIEAGTLELSMHFDGALTPALAKREVERFPARTLRYWATRPGLARALSTQFIPPYLPLERPAYQPLCPGTRQRQAKNLRPSMFFASRVPMAQSRSVETLLDLWEAPTLREVEILTAAPHAKVLAKRRRAHVTACSGSSFLRRSTLEALAAGLCVVSPYKGDWLAEYEALANHEPAPVLDVEQFKAKIDQFSAQQDPDLKTAAWVRRVIDPRRWWERFGLSRELGSKVAA